MRSLVTFFLLAVCSLQADEFRPFKVSTEALVTGTSDFSTPEGEGQDISYSTYSGEFRFLLPFCRTAGMAFTLGYEHEIFDWEESPIFNQTHYNTLDFSIAGFLHSIENWKWILGVGTEVDTSEFNFGSYARYKGMLYGQYCCSDDLTFHFGVLALVGLEKETVMPIFGFDYSPHCRWQLNFVFPKKLGVSYFLSDDWSLALSFRKLSSRHRVAPDAPVPKALFEYDNTGGEFSVNYSPCDMICCKLMAGGLSSGSVKIMDVKGRNSTYFEFDSTYYFGGRFDIEF